MARDYVNYVVEEGIALVTINHPPVNALDQKTVQELGEMIDGLEKKLESKIIILAGAGDKAFVAGGDNTAFVGLDRLTTEKFSLSIQTALYKMGESPKAVICAVNGLYCDVSIFFSVMGET